MKLPQHVDSSEYPFTPTLNYKEVANEMFNRLGLKEAKKEAMKIRETTDSIDVRSFYLSVLSEIHLSEHIVVSTIEEFKAVHEKNQIFHIFKRDGECIMKRIQTFTDDETGEKFFTHYEDENISPVSELHQFFGIYFKTGGKPIVLALYNTDI